MQARTMSWHERIKRDASLLRALPHQFDGVCDRLARALIRGEARWGVIHGAQATGGAGPDSDLSILLGAGDERVAAALAAELALHPHTEVRVASNMEPLTGVQLQDPFYIRILRHGLVLPGSGGGLATAYEWTQEQPDSASF